MGSKTTSEQKTLLEKRTTREVFDQVKDYSSSLYVLRDTASCFSGLTNSTGNSSKMSTVFLFDAELMGSAVYQRAVRSLFRRTVRGRGRDVDSVKLYSTTRSMTQWKKDGAARSRNIDALLKDDARRAQKDVNVLLLSGFESGQEIIMRDIQASNPPNYTISELKCFRTKVLDTLIDTISTILEYLKEESEIWGQIDQKHAETVFKQNTPSEEISLELEIAIASLWEGRAVFLGIVESIEVPETIMYRAF
jgi:hypothetical protein